VLLMTWSLSYMSVSQHRGQTAT